MDPRDPRPASAIGSARFLPGLFARGSQPVLSRRAWVGLTWFAQPTVKFVLVLGVIHSQLEDLASTAACRLFGFLAHRISP